VPPLGSILWNHFGRNLPLKPNLVTFKFVIVPLYGCKIP
jgi:hypothetical protein